MSIEKTDSGKLSKDELASLREKYENNDYAEISLDEIDFIPNISDNEKIRLRALHTERNLIRTDISSLEIAQNELSKFSEMVKTLLDVDEITKLVIELKNNIIEKIEAESIPIQELIYESGDVTVKNEGAVTRFVLSLFAERDNYKDISKYVLNA